MAFLCGRLWRVDFVTRRACDELTGDELTGDELTLWRHDRVTRWPYDELTGSQSVYVRISWMSYATYPQVVSSSWDGRPFGYNIHRPKIEGGCAPLEQELGPHLTQCGLGRDLPPYEMASWSIQLFSHDRHGPRIVRRLATCACCNALVKIEYYRQA